MKKKKKTLLCYGERSSQSHENNIKKETQADDGEREMIDHRPGCQSNFEYLYVLVVAPSRTTKMKNNNNNE